MILLEDGKEEVRSVHVVSFHLLNFKDMYDVDKFFTKINSEHQEDRTYVFDKGAQDEFKKIHGDLLDRLRTAG